MKKKLQRLKACLLAAAVCACSLGGCGQEPEESSPWISMKDYMEGDADTDDSAGSGPEQENSTDGVPEQGGSMDGMPEQGDGTDRVPEQESGADRVPEQESSNIKEEADNVGAAISNDRNAAAEDGAAGTDIYRSILLGDSEFISADLGNQNISIGEIGQVVTDDPGITVSADKFTIIDLNGDGGNEIVLWIRINGVSDYGFEVLHAQDGVVHGYMLVYRQFMNLKTDGTFLFSSGAADSGIGRLSFSEAGYSIEEEFNTVMSSQEEKADVEWYDLSVDSVNTVL